MIISITEQQFNSNLKTYWENDAYDRDLQRPPEVKIVNTGLLFTVEINSIKIDMYAKIRVKQIVS